MTSIQKGSIIDLHASYPGDLGDHTESSYLYASGFHPPDKISFDRVLLLNALFMSPKSLLIKAIPLAFPNMMASVSEPHSRHPNPKHPYIFPLPLNPRASAQNI